MPRKFSSAQKIEIQNDFLEFFYKDFLPFRFAEYESLTKFCTKWIPQFEIPRRQKISESLIPDLFDNCKKGIEAQLVDAETVCITTECWTSCVNHSFMAVTCHFITKDFEIKSILLQCSHIKGSHTAEFLRDQINKTITEWKIIDKV